MQAADAGPKQQELMTSQCTFPKEHDNNIYIMSASINTLITQCGASFSQSKSLLDLLLFCFFWLELIFRPECLTFGVMMLRLD